MNPAPSTTKYRCDARKSGTNFAVFCSGQGTNLQAIINAVKKRRIRANLAMVLCDNPSAYAIKRAMRAGLEVAVVNSGDFKSRKEFEKEVVTRLNRNRIGLIVLAGFMKILSKDFVGRYKNRILNVHPALLPSFKGSHAVRDALRAGVKITGATVHFVTEEVDNGPIVIQGACSVNDDDNEVELLARVHKIEHRIYPRAIDLFARGMLKARGGRVVIKR